MSMKKILLSGLLVLTANLALAVEPLKIILSYAPGGGADLVARTLEKELKAKGRDAYVVYKQAGEGVLAIEELMNSPPDGNTILISGNGPLTIKSIEQEKHYNNIKQLVPVIQLSYMPGLIVSQPASQINSWPKLVAESKKRKLNIGTNSAASRALISELFKGNDNVAVIPFNGEGPMILNLLNNSLDVGIGTYGGLIPQVDAEKLLGVAVTSSTDEKLPFKSLKDNNVNMSVQFFYGVLLPPNTPTVIRDRVFTDISTIMNSKATVDFLKSKHFYVPKNQNTSSFEQFLDLEYKNWSKLIKN